MGLNFVTISLDSTYVKIQFWGPSRGGTPLGALFSFFSLFFSFFFFSFVGCPKSDFLWASNFVTISLDSTYVKIQFWCPSRGVPLWALFSFFFPFFFSFSFSFCCPRECGLNPLCNGFMGGWEQFDPRDGARTRGRASERAKP